MKTLISLAILITSFTVCAETINGIDTSKTIIYDAKNDDDPTRKATPIKLSRNLFCNDEDSPSYDRIKTGIENDFATVEECVEAGFKLPKAVYKNTMPKLYLIGLENDIALERRNVENSKDAEGSPDLDSLTALAKSKAEKESEKEDVEKNIERNKKLAGFDWNLGIALLSYNGDSYIEDVTIVRANEDNTMGTVRIGKDIDYQLSLMLEAHFYVFDGSFNGHKYGHGPFVSVSLATQEGNELGSILGLGYMGGFNIEDGNSFNIGLGYFKDTDFNVMRDNLKDGDMTAAIESSSLLKKKDVGGVMLMLSGTF